jgi:hypothetical protein
MKRFFSLWIGLFFPFVAHAGTQVIYKSPYIFYKTPYNEFGDEERERVLQNSIQMMKDAVYSIVPDLAVVTRSDADLFSYENFKKLEAKKTEVREAVESAASYIHASEYLRGYTWGSLAPTGYLFSLGVTLNINPKVVKASAGGAVYITFVFVPYKLVEFNALTQRWRTRYYLDWDVSVIPTGNFGKEEGFALGRIRVGAGAVWGKLDGAKDFSGLMFGGSHSVFKAVHGVNFKYGILVKDTDVIKDSNIFTMVSYDFGLSPSAVDIDHHINIGYVFSGNKFVKMIRDAFGRSDASGDEDSPPKTQEIKMDGQSDPVSPH